MNKAELVGKVADKVGITKKEAAKAIEAVFGTVQEALVAKEKVQVIGFGSFGVKTRAARTGHNPQDASKKIQIPEADVPFFKAGKALKDSLN